jgi:hypothetical protein
MICCLIQVSRQDRLLIVTAPLLYVVFRLLTEVVLCLQHQAVRGNVTDGVSPAKPIPTTLMVQRDAALSALLRYLSSQFMAQIASAEN